MSINDFIDFLGRHPLATVIALCSVPAATALWALLQGRRDGAGSPWKYGYSVLVYLACVPGVFAAVLLCYTLFFTRQSLLGVNALAYFLPLATMAVSLLIIRARADFKDIPGFGRLSGLFVMIAICFALALAIDKTRLFLGFFDSIDRLFILVGALFVLLKAAFHLAFGRKKSSA